MRRTSLAALITLLALGAPGDARAQNPGTIYFQVDDTPYPKYSVGGDGLNPTYLGDVQGGWPSGRSDYVGGRLFSGMRERGTIPGTTMKAVDCVARDLGGGEIQLTDFGGTVYVHEQRARWSNDNADSFFSFWAHNPADGLYSLYRVDLTASGLSPQFPPVVPGDSRLELILITGKRPGAMDWNWDGTKVVYDDRYLAGDVYYSRTKIHAVGLDTSQTNDFVLNDERISGTALLFVRFSPTWDQIVARASWSSVGGKPQSAKGIGLYTPSNGAWSFAWLQTEYSSKTGGLVYAFDPTFSPDGTSVAFSGKYYRNKYWYPAILRCSTSGGSFSLVTEAPTTNSTTVSRVSAWTW